VTGREEAKRRERKEESEDKSENVFLKHGVGGPGLV